MTPIRPSPDDGRDCFVFEAVLFVVGMIGFIYIISKIASLL